MSQGATAPDAAAKGDEADKIFEDRGPKTTIRLVTVMAYMFSVSAAAVALSGYYLFLWTPPNSRLIHAHAAHLRADSEFNTMEENEIKNRYKYISSPIKGATENGRFPTLENYKNVEVVVQSDEELTRGQNHAKSERLYRGRNKIVENSDSNMLNIVERKNNSAFSTIQQSSNDIPTSLDKENDPQPNLPMKRIFPNNTSTILKPSEEKLSKRDTKSARTESDYSTFENMRIHKKLFKIL